MKVREVKEVLILVGVVVVLFWITGIIIELFVVR